MNFNSRLLSVDSVLKTIIMFIVYVKNLSSKIMETIESSFN